MSTPWAWAAIATAFAIPYRCGRRSRRRTPSRRRRWRTRSPRRRRPADRAARERRGNAAGPAASPARPAGLLRCGHLFRDPLQQRPAHVHRGPETQPPVRAEVPRIQQGSGQRERHYQAVRPGPGLNPPEQQVTGTKVGIGFLDLVIRAHRSTLATGAAPQRRVPQMPGGACQEIARTSLLGLERRTSVEPSACCGSAALSPPRGRSSVTETQASDRWRREASSRSR